VSDRTLRHQDRLLSLGWPTNDLRAYQRQLVREGGDELLLIYRTPYDDPSCKRITRFADFSCALEWIRHHWTHALGWDPSAEEANYERANAITSGNVEGLSYLFKAVAEEKTPAPDSWTELAARLEGGGDLFWGQAKVESPVVSALVDDDDVDLAFYLLPLSHALSRLERSAFMLHSSWRLPTEFEGEGDFAPQFEGFIEVDARGSEAGTLYVVDMSIRVTTYLRAEAAEAVSSVRGLRLPELVGFLRPWEDPTGPPVLRALKAALAVDDHSLSDAVQRCSVHDIEELDVLELVAGSPEESDWGVHPDVHERSRHNCSPHLIQAAHWDGDVFQQWIVFDDLWAAANPELAQSLFWFASDWNPFR